ncbi:MAG: response regulator [Suipraeoptans sp.]
MNKLFIVDDEYVVIEAIKTIITRLKLDFEVIGQATNGIDGEILIEKEQPDIVITDIRMPGKTGLEMIEQLEGRCDCEFIIISGHQEFEYARTALKLGVKAYIDKPLTMDGISAALHSVENIIETKRGNSTAKEFEEAYNTSRESLLECLSSESDENWSMYLKEALMHLKKCGYTLDKYKDECYSLVCWATDLYYEQVAIGEIEQHIPVYQNIKFIDEYSEIDMFVHEMFKSIFGKKAIHNLGHVHKSIEKVLLYIEAHYNEDIGLAEAADLVYMQYTYLSVLFKEEVGMSFVKYLTATRIKHAKQLLLSGYKVKAVAELTGFSSYRYFCDIFKKSENMTPNEFKGTVRGRKTSV